MSRSALAPATTTSEWRANRSKKRSSRGIRARNQRMEDSSFGTYDERPSSRGRVGLGQPCAGCPQESHRNNAASGENLVETALDALCFPGDQVLVHRDDLEALEIGRARGRRNVDAHRIAAVGGEDLLG